MASTSAPAMRLSGRRELVPETNRKSPARLMWGYLGLENTYGIDILLQAFAALVDALQAEAPAMAARLVLKIYGSGSQAQALQAQAVELGIADRTRFMGHIAHRDV